MENTDNTTEQLELIQVVHRERDNTFSAAWAGKIGFSPDAPDMEKLEIVFEIFNLDHPANYRNRSLSVGDRVYLGKSSRLYECEMMGWSEVCPIPEPAGDHSPIFGRLK